MFQTWSQIWQDQGLNDDEGNTIDPTLTAEQWKAQGDAIMDDLEQNCEIIYEQGEYYGLMYPVIRRKAE